MTENIVELESGVKDNNSNPPSIKIKWFGNSQAKLSPLILI